MTSQAPAYIRVTDHALVRFLQRVGGLDIEAVREALTTSLKRAQVVADGVGKRNYNVLADGIVYVVRDGVVVTVLPAAGRDKRKTDTKAGVD